MFIQTEATANPAALKFFPGRAVLGDGSVEYRDAEDARVSPLGQRLFAIPSVTRVALGADFVTVTKDGATDWQILKPAVLGVIMEHFAAGRPVLADPVDSGGDALSTAVRDLIETRIRPAVEGARGTIALRSFASGLATIELGGPPAANATFRNGIENMLRHYVPEVEELRFVAAAPVAADPDAKAKGLDTPQAQAIQALLEQEINPAVAAHGGYVSLVAVEEKRVFLRLEGGCQGCGMASVTLRQGIEVAILEKVPEIEEILDVTDHAGGTNPYYESGHGGAHPYA